MLNPWIFVFLLGVVTGSVATAFFAVAVGAHVVIPMWRAEWHRRVQSLTRYRLWLTEDDKLSPTLKPHDAGPLVLISDVEKLSL